MVAADALRERTALVVRRPRVAARPTRADAPALRQPSLAQGGED